MVVDINEQIQNNLDLGKSISLNSGPKFIIELLLNNTKIINVFYPKFAFYEKDQYKSLIDVNEEVTPNKIQQWKKILELPICQNSII